MKNICFLFLMVLFLFAIGCTKCASNDPETPVPPVEDTTVVVPEPIDTLGDTLN